MKTKIAIALIIGFLLGSHISVAPSKASIKLPQAYFVPGVTSETDAYVAVTHEEIDFPTNTFTVWLTPGTATTSGSNTTAFTPGQQVAPIVVTFNYNAATWTASNGQSGVISGNGLTLLNTIETSTANSVVNNAELFAFQSINFGGTTTNFPWNTNLIP